MSCSRGADGGADSGRSGGRAPERDAGIDLLTYTINPLRVAPIQMKAATVTGWSIDRKYGQVDGLVMVYVWNARSLGDAEFYAMAYQEASDVVDAGGWSLGQPRSIRPNARDRKSTR